MMQALSMASAGYWVAAVFVGRIEDFKQFGQLGKQPPIPRLAGSRSRFLGVVCVGGYN